jgi:hypothetical protein
VRHTIFLFGEAEKGDFCTPLHCHSLAQLVETFGHPPGESKGILYAVQALLYERELIFYRVKEEGFSPHDYMRGLRMLSTRDIPLTLSAICMPGVGDSSIIDASQAICQVHKSFLIIDEKDLYDYLTFPTKPQSE